MAYIATCDCGNTNMKRITLADGRNFFVSEKFECNECGRTITGNRASSNWHKSQIMKEKI